MTPELDYYLEKSELVMAGSPTIFDVYQSFNMSGLFNEKIFQDVWLDYANEGWTNVWN